MTCAVAINRKTTFANHLSCGGVNFGDFDASFYHFYSGCLGFLHSIVNFFVKGSRPAARLSSTLRLRPEGSSPKSDGKTSGNIAAVTFVSNSEIYQYGVIFFELSFAGLMMWTRGVRAKGDDCFKTIRCAELADLKIEHTS